MEFIASNEGSEVRDKVTVQLIFLPGQFTRNILPSVLYSMVGNAVWHEGCGLEYHTA